jgi:hypothetical protein
MQTLSHETQQRLLEHLTAIYGKEQSIPILERLDQIAAEHVRTRTPRPPAKTNWNEQTSVLITYADSLQLSGEWPLVHYTRH